MVDKLKQVFKGYYEEMNFVVGLVFVGDQLYFVNFMGEIVVFIDEQGNLKFGLYQNVFKREGVFLKIKDKFYK